MKTIDKRLLKILIISALIISAASFEALVNVKSKKTYTAYLKNSKNENIEKQPDNIEFTDYILFRYLNIIFLPIVISLYIFFTQMKYGPGSIYRLVFGGMIFIKLITHILKFKFDSAFYYIFIILYVLFFAVIVFPDGNKGGI